MSCDNKFTELIKQNLNRKFCLYLACKQKHLFSLKQPKRYYSWSCQYICNHALHYRLNDKCLILGFKLHGQIVSIPMSVNCAHLVADLFFSVIGQNILRCF